MKRKKQVTLQDLADELELTIHTVSKALRGLPGMSEATRAEVIEAARRLGYRTKEQDMNSWYEKVPKWMTARKRFTLLLTEDSPFFRLQLAGLQDRLAEYGHSVTATFLPSWVTDAGRFHEWVEQTDLMYNDGLFIPPALSDLVEGLLLSLPIPKVLINYPPPLGEVDSVIWDVEHAIRQSVNRFAASRHERILYIGNIRTHRGFRLRWSAFQAAMRGLGVEADARDHVVDAEPGVPEWEKEVEEKLLESRNTAVLCAIDNWQPLLFFLQSRGRSVPADYSLIGLESRGSSPVFPRLSRPALLVREAGRRAAERLLRRIANPAEPYEHTRLAGGFIEGDTVAEPSPGSRQTP